MPYDDNLRIYAGIDQSGIIDGMSDMDENVRRGMEAVNNTAENGMNNFSAIAQAGAVAAGQALFSIAQKAKDAFTDMLMSGDEYNKAMNQLSASTGAVGDELENLKEISKDVFANNYGEDYNDVADAVANVKKQLGDISDEELQSVTESALALRDVFGYEIAESTRAAKAMAESFGISGKKSMGLIAAGAQNGLDYSGELIDSINEYSAQFAKVGLDADDMFNIFQKGAENGAWNLDKVGDAVKEFSIRSIDGSKTTAEGFSAIGLNADEMTQKFGQGGDTAKQAFRETISALSSMEDPIAKDAAGVSLFGTMWEDLGADTVASLGQTQDALYDTGEALDKIKEVKYDNVGSAIEGLKRAIGSFTIDARSAFSADIANSISSLVKVINSADGDINVILDGVINSLKKIGLAFGTVLKSWFETGKKIIEYLIDGIQENIPKLIEKIPQILQLFINGFLNACSRISEISVPIIEGMIEGIIEMFPKLLESGSEILKKIITGMQKNISSILELGKEILKLLVQGIQENISEILDKGLEILQSLITGIIDNLPKLLPLAVNIITSMINGLSQAIVTILEFAPQILTALIDGIIGALPELIGCAVQILDALIKAIIDNLEPILMACLEILMAIVNGIIDNLDTLIDAAFQVIQFLIDELLKNDNLQKILDAAIEILIAISDGIVDNLDKLIDAAFQIIDEIINELLKPDNIRKLITTGVDILVKIIEGLCDLAKRFNDFSENLFEEISTALSEIDWAELGKNILEGICSGLLDVDFNLDEYLGDFKDNWVTGFKEILGIHSPSKVMRDEIGKFILPGIVAGVNDTSEKVTDDINGSLEKVFSKIRTPDKIIEPDTEISPFNIEPPKINVSEQQIEIAEPEPIELNPPKFIEPDTPEISPFNIEPPEINVPEQSEIELNAPEIITDSEPETFDFDISKNNTFTQQIELLRKFSPENNIPQIADERITEEIQSQLDEISVTLNAENFISQFQNILSNIGFSSVPQYSPIYTQTQNIQKSHENSKLELPQNSNQSVPQKLSIFIGDREIRDFIISAINEENAMSGGASF